MDSLEQRKVIPVDIKDEMRSSYLDYAMSVIVSRALPDLRDGLKPVHRRILYSMHESGFYSNKPYKKSARIVGDVIGKYHPHGEASIYDALVRMAQDFSLMLTLVDGQGNFGSIDGDSAAAMRYTESRLSKAGESLLLDIDKNTVNFQPNYDGSEVEPSVLPAIYPNLLVNGSGGIAVGMATNIPPHNLGEVIDGCVAYIENNEITIDELMTYIKGPDFPTAGSIMGISPIKSAYHTGRGIITIRGKAETEEDSKGKRIIVITEIPYAVNKSRLIEKIAELVNTKVIEGISDIRDESDKRIRVVIELKRDGHPDVILNKIYSYTQLQASFGINMLALDRGIPKLLNLKEVISGFILFRKEVITRRTLYLLDQSRSKAHTLVGLYIAVSNIDEVIKIIKGADDANQAKIELMSRSWGADEIISWIKLVDNIDSLEDSRYSISEKQAKAILDMRLHRLTALEKNKIVDEIKKLLESITEYSSILNSEEKLFEIMKNEFTLARSFAKPRLTSIENSFSEKDEEDFIADEEMVVTVTLNGYIKRVPLDVYKSQNRGGKGRIGQAMNEEDVVIKMFVANSKDPVLFFSNMGQVYSLKLYKLPLASSNSKGRAVVNLLSLRDGEQINNIIAIDKNMYREEASLLFATKRGKVRRSDLSDFENIRISGKLAIKFDNENDSLVSVEACRENDYVLVSSKNGKVTKFSVQDLRIIKSKSSDGVRAMNLSGNDCVVGISILNGIEMDVEKREKYLSIPVEQRIDMNKTGVGLLLDYKSIDLTAEEVLNFAKFEQFVLNVTSNGCGKRSSSYEYRTSRRGGMGVINASNSAKSGHIVATLSTNEDDDLILITNKGTIIRIKVNAIRHTSRNAMGVILHRVEKDEFIVSAACVPSEEVVEEREG